MTRFDDFERKRIMRDATMQLREINDEVVLGPVVGDAVKKYIIPLSVTEAALFAGLVCYLIFGLGIEHVSDHLIFVVALFLIAGNFLPVCVLTILFNSWKKTKEQTRFILSPDRGIVVKNERNEEIELPRDAEIEFACKSDFDRNGNEVFDVDMKHNDKGYYILSGNNESDMKKLCEALQNLLSPHP